jgi:hypothetical protein
MVKKRAVTKQKKKATAIPVKENNTEKILIENFVDIQKVMTNLIIKMDNLSGQMSKLLGLFENSAKSLSEKGYLETKTDPKIIEKLNNLTEQNKVIAKGVAMLYEKNNSEEENSFERNISAPQYIPSQQAAAQKPSVKQEVDFSKVQKFGNFQA